MKRSIYERILSALPQKKIEELASDHCKIERPWTISRKVLENHLMTDGGLNAREDVMEYLHAVIIHSVSHRFPPAKTAKGVEIHAPSEHSHAVFTGLTREQILDVRDRDDFHLATSAFRTLCDMALASIELRLEVDELNTIEPPERQW